MFDGELSERIELYFSPEQREKLSSLVIPAGMNLEDFIIEVAMEETERRLAQIRQIEEQEKSRRAAEESKPKYDSMSWSDVDRLLSEYRATQPS